MKNILLVLLLFCALCMSAQITQVSGNQSGTWEGEIHLIDDVIVPDGQTLTINAGTNVISDGYFGITVLGNLYALGEADSEITFTVADTTGYSNYDDPEAGAWKGFLCQKPGEIKFSHCDFSYGKTELDGDGGMMKIFMANDMEIDNCRFHHNTTRKRGGAIYAENSTLNIHDCEVDNNMGTGFQGSYCWGVGFQFLKCNIDMHDMSFHDNYSDAAYGGGMNIDSCNMDLYNAVFYNNIAVNAGGLGIQRCKDYSVRVSNMLAYNNYVVHYGGGLAMATSDPELNNLTIVNNYCGGGGGAGMQTAFEAAPTLNNCIFWGNHAIYTLNSGDTSEYYYGSQIWLWGSDNTPVFNNGDIQYGLDSIYGHEYMTPDQYNDMINADPLFVDAENHDYQLLENSPCVNTGVADVTGLFIPYVDLAGNPRICGGRIDMGCYEFGYAGLDDVTESRNTILVYPNPLNDNAFCVVNLSKKCDVMLRLISLDGKEIYREACGTFDAGQHRIPLDGMMKNLEKANKVYLLNIDNQYVKVIY
ncbi:MAG: right-handed parallel beta-helix repeat-containing protein [Bacteroidales bacterium]|nr:right-handed parallel beta-helix repeat-containing protein [Bacteroidales bacterium]